MLLADRGIEIEAAAGDPRGPVGGLEQSARIVAGHMQAARGAIGREGHLQMAAVGQQGVDPGRPPALLVAAQIGADLAQLVAIQQRALGAGLEPAAQARRRPAAIIGVEQGIEIEALRIEAHLVNLVGAAAHAERAIGLTDA